MSRAVLLSIKPEWCEFIASGCKTIEVRKTRPKLPIPFKCYIYESQGRRYSWGVKPDTIAKHDEDRFLDCRRGAPDVKTDKNGKPYFSYGRMKVVGEFICDEIKDYYPIDTKDPINKPYGEEIEKESCLSTKQVNDYGFRTLGYGMLYGWHISDLVIYDKPRELSDFFVKGFCSTEECEKCKYHDGTDTWCLLPPSCEDEGIKPLFKAPQSWCYVEEPDNV